MSLTKDQALALLRETSPPPKPKPEPEPKPEPPEPAAAASTPPPLTGSESTRQPKALTKGSNQRQKDVLDGGYEGTTNTATAFGDATAYGHAPELEKEELAKWDSDWRLVEFVFEKAGLQTEDEKRQTWAVGGRTLTVSLAIDSKGRWRLWVHEGWPPGEKDDRPDDRSAEEEKDRRLPALPLAEVYAITITKQVRDLRRPELARWQRRALVEAGLIPVPPPVVLPDLPASASPSVRALWPVLAEYLALRRLTDPPEEPFPLVAPWLERWSGGA